MLILLILLMSVLGTAYMYFTRNFNFWKDRGIFYLKPIPFVGNVLPIALLKKPIGTFLADLYRENRDKPYFGIFFADRPCLVVNDVELVENILVKDFSYFTSRIFSPSEDADPLGGKSIFALHGDRWKGARSNLSPAFTSNKLKTIFNSMLEVNRNLEKKVDSVSSFEVSDLSIRYTIDVITTAVLGLNGTALEDPINDPMRNISKKMFSADFIQATKLNVMFLIPQIMTAFRITIFSEYSYNFMRSLTTSIIDERTKKNIKRNDIIEMFMEQQKNGGWKMPDGSYFKLEGDNLASQILMLMTAGYETTSSSLVFCFYELAVNHEVQDKVRKEINDVIEANEGQLTFECLTNMRYIDMVMNETYRKYPPFPFIDRTCMEDFRLPGTNATIPKGTFLMLPMLGLQNDEKYWPNPEKFDPERFRNPDDIKGKPFFPFSMGQRRCLGMRLAEMQLKMALIATIRNHELTTIKRDIKLDPKRFTTLPVENITLSVKSLK